MTESELTALAALANQATPGPWGVDPCSNGGALVKRGVDVGPNRHEQSSVQIVPSPDAAYIAAMHPQTTLGLIAEVRRLRALVESAYGEGWSAVSFRAQREDVTEDVRRDWLTSDARKALEGDKPTWKHIEPREAIETKWTLLPPQFGP